MRKIIVATFGIATFVFASMFALSQPPGSPGGGQDGRGPGRGPGRGGPPPNPVLDALDSNHDHVISADEIRNASAALKKLDRNQDGKLTREELHPLGGPGRGGEGGHGGGEFGRRGGRRGDGGPNGDGRAGRDGGRGHGQAGHGGPGGADEFAKRLLSFDKNEDGKVTKEELPERMQNVLAIHDTNEDGVLDQTELQQIASRSSRFAGDRGPGQEGGPRREGGRPGDNFGGGPPGPPPGNGSDRQGPPGGPGHGPPNPERIVEHAMSFDADDDGKLSRDELMKFAQDVARNRPPRRESGGPPPGAGRFGQPGRDGGDRPGRPARPPVE